MVLITGLAIADNGALGGQETLLATSNSIDADVVVIGALGAGRSQVKSSSAGSPQTTLLIFYFQKQSPRGVLEKSRS